MLPVRWLKDFVILYLQMLLPISSLLLLFYFEELPTLLLHCFAFQKDLALRKKFPSRALLWELPRYTEFLDKNAPDLRFVLLLLGYDLHLWKLHQRYPWKCTWFLQNMNFLQLLPEKIFALSFFLYLQLCLSLIQNYV